MFAFQCFSMNPESWFTCPDTRENDAKREFAGSLGSTVRLGTLAKRAKRTQPCPATLVYHKTYET